MLNIHSQNKVEDVQDIKEVIGPNAGDEDKFLHSSLLGQCQEVYSALKARSFRVRRMLRTMFADSCLSDHDAPDSQR